VLLVPICFLQSCHPVSQSVSMLSLQSPSALGSGHQLLPLPKQNQADTPIFAEGYTLRSQLTSTFFFFPHAMVLEGACSWLEGRVASESLWVLGWLDSFSMPLEDMAENLRCRKLCAANVKVKKQEVQSCCRGLLRDNYVFKQPRERV